MVLPHLKSCCGCLSLRNGFYVLCFISTMACLVSVCEGAARLRAHASREPEDNLLSMSVVMFCSLSAATNLIALRGLHTHRSGYVQLSLLFNSVFIVCLFLVALLAVVFSPELRPLLQPPAHAALVAIALILATAYFLYYLAVMNSLYRQMKNMGVDSAIPV